MGEYNISTVEDRRYYEGEALTVQDISIESAVPYPRYDGYRKINDIALIRLKSRANLEKINIGTVCLPVEEETQFENLKESIKEKLIVAGLQMVYL